MQLVVHRRRVDRRSIRTRDGVDLHARQKDGLTPHGRESATFEDEDGVAGVEHVARGHLPGAVAIADRYEEVTLGLGDRLQAVEQLLGDIE